MTLKWLLLGMLGIGSAQASDMIALRYIDQDPGGPAYLTRIFVTPQYLRMDTGEDGGDFILLDRRQRKVINVLRGNGMIMVFKAGKQPSRPADWAPQLESSKTGRGLRFSLSVKGVTCSEGLAAPGAAPDAVRAMSELKSVLAATQYRVWSESPASMQHQCDLANQVWETGTTLKLGLPLEERDFTGRSRKIEREGREPLKPGLFRIPKDLPSMEMPS